MIDYTEVDPYIRPGTVSFMDVSGNVIVDDDNGILTNGGTINYITGVISPPRCAYPQRVVAPEDEEI